MERHQSLYKSALLAGVRTQKQNANRERQNESRAMERKRIFLSRRNIEELVDEKENASDSVAATPLANSTRIAKVANPVAPSKLSRQAAYLQRLIHWKTSKEQSKEKHLKRPPFLPCGNNAGKKMATTSTTRNVKPAVATAPASFAPKNHEFKAPAGLSNPAAKEEPIVPSDAPILKAKVRQSFYTVVPTPPRKHKAFEAQQSSKRATPAQWLRSKAIEKIQPQQQSTTPAATATLKAATSTTKAETATKTATKAKPTPSGSRKPLILAQTNTRKTPALAVGTKSNTKPTTATKNSVAPSAFAKPRLFKLPAASPPAARKVKKHDAGAPTAARIVKPIRGGGAASGAVAVAGVGAVGKAKQHLQQKRPPTNAVKLSVAMKAKKPTSVAANAIKRAPSTFKLNGKLLLNVPDDLPEIAETPTDFSNNANPFGGAFITSTKCRETSVDSEKPSSSFCDGISPVEALHGGAGQRGSSAAKRALLQGKMDVRKDASGDAEKGNKKRFNFVRVEDLSLSVLPTEELGSAPVKELTDSPLCAVAVETVGDVLQERTLQNTPSKDDNAERPANYLSPFVSVSRGKVNIKQEREKRNSIYLQQPSPPPAAVECEEDVSKSSSEAAAPTPVARPTTPVEVRRAIETVRYFRQQLSSEIARLHALCDQWEAHKSEHLARLQETGGEDMINVTVGQTKLLTTKKFKQFSGLIDRCEAGALGTGVENDGSEGTKPITTVDLEGFWCMVGLQVDNVDKRFENLTRWKANDWMDPDAPDEVTLMAQTIITTTSKPKKNLSKVKKAKCISKAKPSSSLQQMLRKMHAEMRKNKAEVAASSATESADNDAATNPDVVLPATPTNKRRSHIDTPRSSTPRRISIIVRDRKSRSAAATVISVPAPTNTAARRDSVGSQFSPVASHLRQHVMALRRRSILNLQKAALMNSSVINNENCQSVAPPPSTPPAPPTTRKSILKTPGTANGTKKNVIFNQKVYMKKFKFTVTESDQSEMDD